MTITIVKILVIVGLTHGLRWLSQKAGPHWGGLLAGLPSTSAVVLFFLACENGEEYATRAASSGALGLCAGSALALVFAWAVSNGRSLIFALAAAGVSFVGVAAVSPLVLSLAAPMPLLLVISASCLLAAVAQSTQSSAHTPISRSTHAAWRGVILRTIIPTVCVLSVTMLSQRLGAIGAGLLGTFPCMLTSMLVVIALEDGVASAGRLAQSFPVGQLATLSFVILFGKLCPSLGVTVSLLVGYMAAVMTLGAIEWGNRVQQMFHRKRECLVV